MRAIFGKNLPIDETRVSMIEDVVTRLARRSRKIAKAIITPFPISNAVFGEDVRGSILRYMFPSDGKIIKGMIRFDAKPKDKVDVTVMLMDDLGGTAKTFLVEKRQETIEMDIPVHAGHCMDISVRPTSDSPLVGVWIAFLWVPDITETEIKEVLIEELENGLLEE